MSTVFMLCDTTLHGNCFFLFDRFGPLTWKPWLVRFLRVERVNPAFTFSLAECFYSLQAQTPPEWCLHSFFLLNNTIFFDDVAFLHWLMRSARYFLSKVEKLNEKRVGWGRRRSLQVFGMQPVRQGHVRGFAVRSSTSSDNVSHCLWYQRWKLFYKLIDCYLLRTDNRIFLLFLNKYIFL